MELGFEDIFTEIQSDCVSLCMEYAKGAADMIYVFIYQGKEMRTFNAFFRQHGQVKTLAQVGDVGQIGRLFELGLQNVKTLIDHCRQYGHPCPNEIRMTFDAAGKRFEAAYAYEDYALNEDIDPDDVFRAWIQQEKSTQ